jgi:hypothetical protein
MLRRIISESCKPVSGFVFFVFLCSHDNLLQAEEPSFEGTLTSDTTLTAQPEPWHITGNIFIPAGKTLTIEPGANLMFEEGTGITVQEGGCLSAEGSESQNVGLLRLPDSNSHWRGIEFHNSLENNRLSYVNMEYGDYASHMILVDRSRLFIDHATWTPSDKTVIEVSDPSLIVSYSVFPAVSNVEPVHGQKLSGDAYLIIENNTFSPTTGYNDVIDFSECKRPGPILQVLNNTFLGGGDDALDLDGCDAHIEGNLFMNFHQDQTRPSTSNAIATGRYNGSNSEITVVRNIFTDNDHAILLKEDAFLRADNNVFVNSVQAAINFSEFPYRDVDPGQGASLDGNIFYHNAAVFENQFAQPGARDPVISVNHSIIESRFHDLGKGNLDADPLFVDPAGDFHLTALSPAIGSGPNGLDMGRYVPSGASISGEPDSLTEQTQAVLTIGGPGITHYQYCINDTAAYWSDMAAIDSTSQIVLNDLIAGQSYTVYVRGKNSASVWQSEPAFAVSKTWEIQVSDSHDSRYNHTFFTREFHLYQNVPNPFNSITHIVFHLSEYSKVEFIITDLSGRAVRTFPGRFYQTGSHEIIWKGQTDKGEQVPSGLYFVRTTVNNQRFTRKMLLIQ